MIDIKSEIESVRNSNGKRAGVFRNLCSQTPGWDKFINHINSKAHEHAPWHGTSQPLEERVVGAITLRNMFYVIGTQPDKIFFPETQPLYDIFEPILGEMRSAATFVNFVTGEPLLKPHLDNRETIYWQCIGSSKWRIYEEDAETLIEEHHLFPGDVLFIARNTFHTVFIQEPRAAIVLEHV